MALASASGQWERKRRERAGALPVTTGHRHCPGADARAECPIETRRTGQLAFCRTGNDRLSFSPFDESGQMRLEGKRVLITGTAGGQGKAAQLMFAKEGARIVGCDIQEGGAERTAAAFTHEIAGSGWGYSRIA